jgi:hypothetical protein
MGDGAEIFGKFIEQAIGPGRGVDRIGRGQEDRAQKAVPQHGGFSYGGDPGSSCCYALPWGEEHPGHQSITYTKGGVKHRESESRGTIKLGLAIKGI